VKTLLKKIYYNGFMLTVKQIAFIIALIFLELSCVYTEKASTKFLWMLDQSNDTEKNHLPDKVYSEQYDENYQYTTEYKNGKVTHYVTIPKLESPLLFFKNEISVLKIPKKLIGWLSHLLKYDDARLPACQNGNATLNCLVQPYTYFGIKR